MIRIIPIFLTLFFSIPVLSETKWIKSLDKGISIAKEENKPILVDLYTDWCLYCKDLENKIFPSKDVATELEKFVTVRINGDESQDIVSKYSVRGYPTILLLDKNGNYIEKITGLPNNALLITKMQEAYIKKDIESNLLAEQKNSPDSVLSNFNLGVFYYRNEKLKSSLDYFLKSYNATEKDNEEKRQEALFMLGLIQLQEKNFSESISIWNSYMEKYPENKKGSALYCRGISYYFAGKKQEAKSDLLKAKEFSTSKDMQDKIQMFLSEL